jgi:DsbC/DsbD-like thiol-disulfide interchange protein
MTFTRRLAILGAAVVVQLSAALADQSADWADGAHSRARLISGGVRDGVLLAGIEIDLDEGFKTYWRTPGDSGLPPRFDWSGSSNASEPQVLFPAPERLEDAAGVSYVYKHRTILPVMIKVPAQGPISLKLSLEYGVCKDICIPAQADLSLVADRAATNRTGAIRAALDHVPRKEPLGGWSPVSITAVAPVQAEKPTLRVTTRSPAPAILFAEAPEGWFVSTSAPTDNGAFTVTVEERPANAAGGDLVLTLVSGDSAVETRVPLDDALLPR